MGKSKPGLLIGFFFWFTLLLNPATAPCQAYGHNHLIQQMNKYRQHLLEKDSVQLTKINILLNQWKTVEPDTVTVYTFLLCIMIADHFNIPMETAVELFKDELTNSSLLNQFNEYQHTFIRENKALLILLMEGILAKEYPYKLQRSDHYGEIEFYEIKPGEKVAEIGSFSPFFLLMLASQSIHISIFSIESDNMLSEFKKDILQSTFDLSGLNKIEFTTIKKRSLGLKQKVDKILLRRNFNENNESEELLMKAHKALLDHGILFLAQSKCNPLDIDCLWQQELLITKVTQANFKFEEKRELEEDVVFKFSKISKPD